MLFYKVFLTLLILFYLRITIGLVCAYYYHSYFYQHLSIFIPHLFPYLSPPLYSTYPHPYPHLFEHKADLVEFI